MLFIYQMTHGTVLFKGLFFKKKFLCLYLILEREKERERKSERERAYSHPLAHSSSTQNSQNRGRLKPGARNLLSISHLGVSDPTT